MNIKVIGAGFGRTGTASLRDALEKLDFDKCYHMSDLFKNDNALKWLQKVESNNVAWDVLLDGCKAGVDWPVAAFYKELAELNPDAKVILTVRDADSWYRSITSTIYPMSRLIPAWQRWIHPNLNARYKLLNKLIWNGIFQGRLEDAEFAKDVFNKHNEAVQQHLGPDRLLVYEVSQGWEPLCEFLNVPVPADIAFPRKNASQDRKKDITRLRVQRLAPYAVLGAIVFALLAWML